MRPPKTLGVGHPGTPNLPDAAALWPAATGAPEVRFGRPAGSSLDNVSV